MTSRSSSWVSLLENNKRRIWLWLFFIFLFVVILPILLIFALTSIDVENLTSIYGEGAKLYIEKYAVQIFHSNFGASFMNFSAAAVAAVVAGFNGFSYLCNKEKVDFYESMPEKKGNRFSTIWLNGIIMFTLTYAVGMLIKLMIFVLYGYGSCCNMFEVLSGFCIVLLFYLGVYHIAILSIILSGNVFLGACYFILISSFEFALRVIVYGYSATFYVFYHGMGIKFIPILSPIGLAFKITDKLDGGFLYVMILCLIDFAFLVLSYVLFVNRPMESAGKSLAFPRIATPTKLLATIPFTSLVALLAIQFANYNYSTRKYNFLPVLLSILVITVISCCTIQAIFEQDIKAFFHKPWHLLITAVAVIAILLWFQFDPFSVDEYVPKPEKVSYSVFIPQGYSSDYVFLDDELGNLGEDEYCIENMHIYDSKKICELAEYSIDRYNESSEDERNEKFHTAIVIYTLKSGRKVSRVVYVPIKDEKTDEYMTEITSTSDFKKGYFDFLNLGSENIVNNLVVNDKQRAQITFTDSVFSAKMTEEELKMAIDCLIKDYENFDYSKIKKEYPIGKINFFMNNTFSDMTAGYYEDSFERGLIIFPCFENCVNYLNSIGVIDELGFDYSSINRVSITNYNNEQRNAEITELESHGEYVDYEALDIKYSKTTTYSGDYEELFENINFTSGSFWRFDGGADLDYDYEVDIFFEENSKDALRCEMNPVYTYLKQGYTPKGF